MRGLADRGYQSPFGILQHKDAATSRGVAHDHALALRSFWIDQHQQYRAKFDLKIVVDHGASVSSLVDLDLHLC